MNVKTNVKVGGKVHVPGTPGTPARPGEQGELDRR